MQNRNNIVANNKINSQSTQNSSAEEEQQKEALKLENERKAKDLEDLKVKAKDCVKQMVSESPSKQDASKALNMLYLILENLRKHPQQEKYRKVNTTSSRFKERFGSKNLDQYAAFSSKLMKILKFL